MSVGDADRLLAGELMDELEVERTDGRVSESVDDQADVIGRGDGVRVNASRDDVAEGRSSPDASMCMESPPRDPTEGASIVQR